MSKQWQIVGYDGMKKLFSVNASYEALGEASLFMELLKTLTATCGGLTAEEIVSAYTPGGNSLLSVKHDREHGQFTCGSDPHVVAKLIDG